jgi:hypothetical protein
MLKSVNEINLPDPRYRCTVGPTGAPMTPADQHESVAAIQLHERVPLRVAEVFDRARNAFIYAWFVYEFGALAEAQAYFTLEFALRERMKVADDRNAPTLRPLLDMAVARGLLKDDPWHAGPGLAFVVPLLRNSWAHGTDAIHEPAMSLKVIAICADLINH